MRDWNVLATAREGGRGTLHSQEAERLLAGAVLEALEAAGRPGRVAFEDADAVVALDRRLAGGRGPVDARGARPLAAAQSRGRRPP